MKAKLARKEKLYAQKKQRRHLVKPGTLSQAGRIFCKFGGPTRLSEILTLIGRHKAYSTVFKWDYPISKGGRGGLIPAKAWPHIFLAARFEGIVLTSEDIDPRAKFMNEMDLRAFPRILRKNAKSEWKQNPEKMKNPPSPKP